MKQKLKPGDVRQIRNYLERLREGQRVTRADIESLRNLLRKKDPRVESMDLRSLIRYASRVVSRYDVTD